MPNPERVLLLDTHVWLWLMSREGNMKPSSIRAVEEAAHHGLVRVSAISLWEVAMLEAKGRIRTRDEKILAYGKAKHLSVMAV